PDIRIAPSGVYACDYLCRNSYFVCHDFFLPDDSVVDLRNLVRDYYYFKDLQSAVALKLTAELKVSFPAYAKVFSKVTTQSSLKLLSSYPLPEDMLAASKEDIVDIIRSTARFGEAYALRKYDAIISAAQD